MRLFIPMAVLVWAIIGAFVWYQFYQEKNIREVLLRQELTAIDQRVLHMYERGMDLQDFMDFMSRYYDNSVYDDIHITVYDRNDSIIATMGSPVSLDIDSKKDLLPADKSVKLVKTDSDFGDHEFFYISAKSSPDGEIRLRSAMPYSLDIDHAINTTNVIWILVVLAVIAATLTVYLSTRLIMRNIEKMQTLVRRMAAGEEVPPKDTYANDELGNLARDISEIYEQRSEAMAHSERGHRIAIHAIEEKAQIKRQMTNNINHELKTPIGVIRGYLDTINDNPDMDADTRHHFMQRARENVERLCSLLNDISTITRLEEGSENIPLSPVSMHDLAFGIENDIRQAKLLPGMKFEYSIPLDCKVLGNQNLLSGMLLNLAKNAAIHSHGTEVHFNLISESSKFYVFAFYDNGRGVSSEHLPHLFDRFYRVDSGRSRKVGGTGLGLPIVQNTVLSLGGTISVHNRSNGGLEFVFSLRKAQV